ncbi:nuclear transcription factor Y subunit gamma-like [Anthonomus grandis grandis]|uniref:nuclear transcription factor Y subunit gamma-like n=1 Tax=Anthonomus grandis grandis TaxID=2921223 RepID=UPI002165FCED|nr:nuclear transcription factor Y subunit gamma-like [Anthonomus grandis grandis]
MSMYFFRLHNLRRAQEEEDKRKKKQQQQQQQQQRLQQRGSRPVGPPRYHVQTPLTLAPSRLFERPPLTPSDSLDEVALQIPRVQRGSTRTALGEFMFKLIK